MLDEFREDCVTSFLISSRGMSGLVIIIYLHPGLAHLAPELHVHISFVRVRVQHPAQLLQLPLVKLGQVRKVLSPDNVNAR